MCSQDGSALSDRLNDPDATSPLRFVLVGICIPDKDDGDGHEHGHDQEAADKLCSGRGRQCQYQVPDRRQRGEERGEWATHPEPIRKEGYADDHEELSR